MQKLSPLQCYICINDLSIRYCSTFQIYDPLTEYQIYDQRISDFSYVLKHKDRPETCRKNSKLLVETQEYFELSILSCGAQYNVWCCTMSCVCQQSTWANKLHTQLDLAGGGQPPNQNSWLLFGSIPLLISRCQGISH